MSDVQLHDFGQHRDRLGGLKVEAVSCMHFEAELFRACRALLDPLEFDGSHGVMPVDDRLTPCAGMYLDHRRADLCGGLDLLVIRCDEQRDANARRFQFGDHRHQMIALADHVQPTFGGYLLSPLRHDAGGVRTRLQRDIDHLAGRRHFEIERLGELRLQARDIVVANMTAIFAQMRRDTIRSSGDGNQCGLHGIGMPPAARVANGGDVIDVDAEAEFLKSHVSQGIQFSIFNPTMRRNSRSLPVTSVSPNNLACAAIQRSLPLMISPFEARSARRPLYACAVPAVTGAISKKLANSSMI